MVLLFDWLLGPLIAVHVSLSLLLIVGPVSCFGPLLLTELTKIDDQFGVFHNFTSIVITLILNQKRNPPWYYTLVDCWVRMVLLPVSIWMIVWLSVILKRFVDFHCCHCRLTSFYFITSFFVSYYLTMGITNMMLYSINSDAAVVRRPYPANYCFVYNSLTSSFLFLFILFVDFFYSFGLVNPPSSFLVVRISVGSPATLGRL